MNIKKIIQHIVSFALGGIVIFLLSLVFIPQQVRTNIISPSNVGGIGTVGQVYNVLRNYHYFYDGDNQDLIDGAIEGMIEVLDDPHTSYFSMNDYEDFVGRLEETYSGIGCEVTSMNGHTIVVSPLPNSPAEEAGILVNDIIVEVDGENVVGENLQAVVNKIKGPIGTAVELGIQRGETVINIKVERAEIPQETVEMDMITTDEANIGYILVTSFGENTAIEFIDAIETLEAEGMDSLIVNLRNNSGGYLTAVVEMLDYLLPADTVITSVQDRNGDTKETLTTGRTSEKDYPIVTLINEGSASASEIFAAAMKEAAGQEVVGMTSYGKGTVQETINIDDESVLKLTTQVWLTSEGNWIEGIGVEPTIEIQAPYFYSFFQVYLPDNMVLEYDLVSPAVENAQNILQTLGYPVERTDGYYDDSTTNSVSSFQRDQGLEVTGIIERETANALTKALRDKVNDRQYDEQLQKAIELLS